MIRVCGTVDGFPFKQYNIMPMGDGKMFFPVNAAIRKVIKKEAGDKAHVILYLDDTAVEIPDILEICLNDDPSIKEKFYKMTDAKKKEIVDYIMKAKKEETKANRIAYVMGKIATM
jgi:uncharacterized protein YdeI (YjbR/CyaY-like superfamily)